MLVAKNATPLPGKAEASLGRRSRVRVPPGSHFIVEKGVFMLENLNLEELSRDMVYQFLCCPIRAEKDFANSSKIKYIITSYS
ncbi:MAG: hypothetical protein QXM16_01865 [Nitrososphaerota archaeon]